MEKYRFLPQRFNNDDGDNDDVGGGFDHDDNCIKDILFSENNI